MAARRWRDAVLDAGRLPLVGNAVAGAYRRHFNRAHGRHVRLFQGIFTDYAAAAAAVPSGWRSGYDNAASAERVFDEWLEVYPNDYPVMFWLAKIVANARLVFDWGGNVGLKYFAYRKYVDYPPSMTWLVNDVPAVVEFARNTVRREESRNLRFTTALDEIAGADVLLAAGVLHFIENPLAALRTLPALPPHLLLNKVPAYGAPSAWTLHNMGTAMCPYRLFNRDELVSAIEGLGYELIDEWKFPDVWCAIPFFPDNSIAAYSGFYFTRRSLGFSRGRVDAATEIR
jgi:putative methyltransferase (TIGR04325 family)